MSKAQPQPLQVDHLRRCHHCNYLNSSNNSEILQCEKCKRNFAPFFFFNLSELRPVDAGGAFFALRQGIKTEYQAIYGLSVYWDHE